MKRMRRLRKSTAIRESLAEVKFSLDQLIFPLFIVDKTDYKKEISTMPGIYQISSDKVKEEVEPLFDLGVKNYILFGIPEIKDFEGEEAANPEGPVPNSLSVLKESFGENISLYADVCLCEYTTHGHCGIPDDNGWIQNDPSLDRLSDAALAYAHAGADWVAPSNMMDGRVSSIRTKLDDHGYNNTAILSYSAKFASNYYGPFRDAAESPPQFGDRRTYQIDYRSPTQAIREVKIDEEQGADATMVKPALAYLDILEKASNITDLPMYAYNVSGEYSMIKLGVKHGIFSSEKDIVLENLTAMFRAGADLILTYHTADIARNGWLK